MVHAAGFANREFVERHPNFEVAVGERIRITLSQAGEWFDTVTEFAEATDKFIVGWTRPKEPVG